MPSKKKSAAGSARIPATAKSTQRVRWNDTVQSREEVAEAKRLSIIRAAGEAFRRKGFHGTSLDEVAAALNVTKPTLYYYVHSKQDLLYRCHDHALDLGLQALEYSRGGVTGLEKLQRMVTRYIELITDDFAAYSLLSDLNDMLPQHKSAIRKRRREFDAVFRGFVTAGIADGSIRPCDPMMTVAWFMGAVNAIPRWFEHDGPMTGSEVAATYTDLLTRGVAA